MTEMNEESLLASEWNKMEEMIQVLEPFASHTNMLQTDASSLSIIIPSLLNLEYHLQQVSAAKTVTTSLLSAFWCQFGYMLQPDITNFNPVPLAACLMDPTVGACLLAPELAGLLHAAKLYVIQQAVKETQQATDNSDSTTASTSLVRAPVLY